MKNNQTLKTAVIMAGGQGTRLQSITGPLPKPMVNIRGTQNKYFGQSKDTILEHQIDVLSENGITNFILVVGNKKEFIKSAFTTDIINRNVYTNTPYDRNINISFFEEQAPLGTGGSFCSKDLQQLTNGEDFLLTYADNLFDVNVQSMHKFHKLNNASVTVLISPCKDPDDRALCVFDKNSTNIISMIPKQGKEDGPRGGIFPNTPTNGLMILSNSFFSVLPENPMYLDFEEDVLMRLIYNPAYKVCGWESPCYIKDVGIVPRFYEGVKDLDQKIPETKNPDKYTQTGVIFKESDLLIQDTHGKISVNDDISYSIAQLNKNGIITFLEKDISGNLNFAKENDLIDTLLVRSQNPSFFNAKISELTDIETYAEEWNMPPQNIFYVAKQDPSIEDSLWIFSSLDPNAQPTTSENILSTINCIVNENSLVPPTSTTQNSDNQDPEA